jgi:hypothetical protein
MVMVRPAVAALALGEAILAILAKDPRTQV